MESIDAQPLGEYFGKLAHDSDLLEELTSFASRKNISSGVFTVIGAVKYAKLGFYDQEKKEYCETEFNEPMEIISCNGNITLKDGVKFAHAHACLCRKDHSTIGGHVFSMRVFAGEFHLRAFKDIILREYDAQTGLGLMDLQ
ncbi:MAG: PPC domain-containing DNA-binding protein [Candidatus Altiarchaeota archaeon]